MKGLLLKDFYMMRAYCRSLALLVAVFLGAAVVSNNSMFFLLYPCVVSGMIPMSLQAYDEAEKWTVFSGTLPYTKAQLVSVKYLTGLLINGVVIAWSALFQLGKLLLGVPGAMTGEEILVLAVISGSVGLITPALMLPFVFRFGPEKGRIAYRVVIVCVCVLFPFLSIDASLLHTPLGIGGVVLLVAGTAAVYAVSWLLSIAFYKKREI